MGRQVTATQAKTRLLALLDDVEGGESIEITRRGQLVARLVPARGAAAIRGRFVDVAASNASDEALFSTGEEWELR